MKSSIWVVVLLVLTAIVVGGAVYIWVPRTMPNVTVDEVNYVAQIVAVQHHISVTLPESGKCKVSPRGWKIIYSLAGVVSGKVNLEKCKTDIDNKPENRKVVIKFHKGSIEVSGVEINKQSRNEMTCNKPSECPGPTDNQKKQYDATMVNMIRDTAIANNIVNQTKNGVQTVLEKFLLPFGYKVIIEFDKEAFDPSAKW